MQQVQLRGDAGKDLHGDGVGTEPHKGHHQERHHRWRHRPMLTGRKFNPFVVSIAFEHLWIQYVIKVAISGEWR